MEEGYVKFNCNWTPTAALPEETLQELQQARQKVYAWGGIGAYDNGIGFGNISQRYRGEQFLISGSATGNFSVLGPQHFSWVTNFDIHQNRVACQGPIKASSESMSHAVIYQQCPEVNAVIHLHHLALWKRLRYQIPTTAEQVAYGTPEMANAIIELLQQSTLRHQERFLAMAGHREGLIAFGEHLSDALALVARYLQK
ncbi:MAG: class II aldolase/adducin family protein [Bacteroidota bacterium]